MKKLHGRAVRLNFQVQLITNFVIMWVRQLCCGGFSKYYTWCERVTRWADVFLISYCVWVISVFYIYIFFVLNSDSLLNQSKFSATCPFCCCQISFCFSDFSIRLSSLFYSRACVEDALVAKKFINVIYIYIYSFSLENNRSFFHPLFTFSCLYI